MTLCDSFFFFKQKTAYEMRISDWSSDVCSSDLLGGVADCVGRNCARFRPWHLVDVHMFRITRIIYCTHPATLCTSPRYGHHREIGRASCRERVCQYV